MQALTKRLKKNLMLCIFSSLVSIFNPVWAASDREMQEEALKALEMKRHGGHSAPVESLDKNQEFRGVFYGYLPCADCDGIKATLSLKSHNNYLLVTQPARESSKEFYEKGKYTWDEDTRTVVLTARDQSTRHYRIADEGTLVQLNTDGTTMLGDEEGHTLRRGDTVKSRQVHIH
ncbi:copper resistance protein NlpE [Crenothrix polyspora]|uniref:Lipoprotein NlpE involved in copper resistance n=1 Tax=Crenothrix polyspora TaxID=360316 RepID=A0A1R4H8A5_9GAMM|nr:copper resistance protein NlpE [Crenothrix polyspora]SJM92508.1 conserved exported hypothetical protein [Crenothrix polyspora]